MTGPGEIAREVGIPWPAADEGALREAANTWHILAESIRDSCGPANSAATSLTSNNAGAAIDAFENYWQKFGGTRGALPLAAEACDAMSTACSKYADEVAAAKWQIEKAGMEAGGALIVGTIGAVVTFGTTEALADVTAASITSGAIATIGAIGGVIARFIPAAEDAVTAAEYAAASIIRTPTAEGLVASGLKGTISTIGGTITADTGKNVARQILGEKPLSPSEMEGDLTTAVKTGAVGGVIGKLGELTTTQLATVVSSAADSVSQSDPQLYMQMLEMSRQLRGTTGTATAGVLSTVATQLITSQQISSEGIAKGQLNALLKRLAKGGGG